MYHLKTKQLSYALAFLLLINAAFSASGEAQHPSIQGQPKGQAVKQQSITQHPSYPIFIKTLQQLVNQQAQSQVNHFFVAHFKDISNENTTWLLWREGRELRNINICETQEQWQAELLYARASDVIELDQDVVATVDEIGYSTYLVDQAFVNQHIFNAVVNGDLIVINKIIRDCSI